MPNRKVVVITGASSGIGRSIALRFAKSGVSLVLSGRNRDALDSVGREAAGLGAHPFLVYGDVTDESTRESIVTDALREFGQIDVLINNAGRGIYGSVESVDVRELERIFALNVIAPVRLSQLALTELRRTRGTIVMLSSVAGVVSVPRLGPYAASKFALEALSLALRAEVAASGVRVLVVRPGPVDTEFRSRAAVSSGESGVRPTGAKVQSPEDVANQTFEAIEAGDSVLETTAFVKLSSAAARVAPPLLRWVSKRMSEKR